MLSQLENAAKTSPYDHVRRTHLSALARHSGRNVVTYYSGWLSKSGPGLEGILSINDDDKNGFMACFHQMEWDRGLDLIIHSPGGNLAATESITHYVRSKFGKNVRTLVPQISMSGGTIMAMMGYEIIMGHHSNLGPIDPQFGSVPAIGVIKEFQRAAADIKADASMVEVWRPILSQYPPTFLSTCEQAIEWTKRIAHSTLVNGMFDGLPDASDKANAIVERFILHDENYSHSRHLHREDAKNCGLIVTDLEADQDLQDLVLSVHHATIMTLQNTSALKIVENDRGVASIRAAQQ